MKKLLPFLFLFLPVLAMGQDLPIAPESNLITYTEVVQIDGENQAELYNRARLWFAKTFKSSQDVIQLDSKETGTISGKAWQDIIIKPSVGSNYKLRLHFTLTLILKDGRYKYAIDNLSYTSYPGVLDLGFRETPAESILLSPKARDKNNKLKSNYKPYAVSTDQTVQAIIVDLKNGLSKPLISNDF